MLAARTITAITLCIVSALLAGSLYADERQGADIAELLDWNSTYTPFAEADYDVLLNVRGSAKDDANLDLDASYVWESSRFGQFVLRTRTRYLAPQSMIGVAASGDSALEAFSVNAGELGAASTPTQGLVPDMHSSFEFSWQIGNHVATAATHYASDPVDDFGTGFSSSKELTDLSVRQLDELVGQIAALDLRYGYNLKTGRSGNTLFSIGIRSTVDRRPAMRLNQGGGGAGGAVLDANGRVAYGSIKYQF